MNALLFMGYKTYLCAIGIALTAAAEHLGLIDPATATTLKTLFGAGGLAALRAGVSKGANNA